MEQFLKNLILLSVLQFFINQNSHGCNDINGVATCDFQNWSPPLMDSDFGPEPVYNLKLKNINDNIPAGAFSGLNGSLTNTDGIMEFKCIKGGTRLSRDIFTPNLHWLTELHIIDCYIKNGLPSRLLENLKSLGSFGIYGGSIIDGSVAHDTLAGLTNLQQITVNAPLLNGRLPPCFFHGLKKLTVIYLIYASLDFIPPSWLNGLDSLKNIYLFGNNLHTLPLGLFDELLSLETVVLHSNPWNCSCDLMWLLDWSHITDGDGVICHSPSFLNKVRLEDVAGLLNCTTSTPTNLSTPVCSETETTETQTAPVTTIAAYSLQNEWVAATTSPAKIFAVPVTTTAIRVTFAGTPTSTSATTTTFMAAPTASRTVSSTDEAIKSSALFNFSSVLSTKTTFVQTYYSNTGEESARNTGANSTTATVNILHYAILISVVGAVLAVLLMVAVILYRCVCWNKQVGRLNRVNGGEDGRNGPVSNNRQYQSSSLTTNLQTNSRITGS